MPRRDGTGPLGGARGAGRGKRQGPGRGVMGGNLQGAGPGGSCVCLNCNISVPHVPGVPCYEAKCPKCGASMIRQ